MVEAILNASTTADAIDIQVGFFYFSGWRMIAEQLKDKKIRIIVGKYIDPKAVPELLISMNQNGENLDLEPFRPRVESSSRVSRKDEYLEGFVRLANETALFDEGESQDAYEILEKKVLDGSLEIKMTGKPEHGKMYIFHNKEEFAQNGDNPGSVLMGSSNFTFQGLQNQGELNDRFDDKSKHEEYFSAFKKMWNDAEDIDIAVENNTDHLVQVLKNDLWIHSIPKPYSMYLRVLHEIFGGEDKKEIESPSAITDGRYLDLLYQIDAIKSVIDKLAKYDGVILADVVGLGKSIIASAAAYLTGLRVVIISPSHLVDQWEDYQEDFKLAGARVYSSGKMSEPFSRYSDVQHPILIIVDEAHRFRNEDTDDYRMLHHIANSHPQNKVILLTATPFNNDPKDVFALIRLFQVPGQSTIQSVDNLSIRFRDLITRYKRLNRDRRSGTLEQVQIDKEADEIAVNLRLLIENIVIRRSRLDLKTITRYREDLERQNVEFSTVKGPNLLSYDLGRLFPQYQNTISRLTEDGNDEADYIGARYMPTTYIRDSKLEEFLATYGNDFEPGELQHAQTNMAKLMKRLLVMRFESSKEAFNQSLSNIINSNILIEEWWEKLGKVPILKKGSIPDAETLLSSSSDNVDAELNQQHAENEIANLKESKGLIAIDKNYLKEDFILDVVKDRKTLEDIQNQWYGPKAADIENYDPKLDKVKKQVEDLILENSERKIVIFSSYADTVNYMEKELRKRGMGRIIKYTGGEGKAKKQIVRQNFDAGLRSTDQKNDFDILISTDTLSEGINLHRAGIIINYDIPYNPTRVIQRIGRINRINKKVFDSIEIFNCFPTATGEHEVNIRQISTLKMRLINSIVGSDTRTLTDDEKLESFFRTDYEAAEKESEVRSWDAVHRENYFLGMQDTNYFDEAMKITPRSRVVRNNKKENRIVAFGKKGEHSVFGITTDDEPQIIPAEVALNKFAASKDEIGEKSDSQYDEVFILVRDKLFKKHSLPKVAGRRADSLKKIKLIETSLPKSVDYCKDLSELIRKYDGINEGDLKRINKIAIQELEKMFIELKTILPVAHITSIRKKAEKNSGNAETIVLSQELRQ
jgi:superfamily II DNA/RNA helicase/HKD family nuclease